MEATMIASEFGKPPLIFKGSALYQIHVVKAEIVRPFIPKELKIVENFGYTVGGFFLANYEDSPFGAFDELVVIAGIVRNNRSSCAWAADVFVNNDEACESGRKDFGLPSQVAKFSKKCGARHDEGKPKGFKNCNHIIKIRGGGSCNLSIQTFGTLGFSASAASGLDFNKFFTPRIKLSLPSLSGLTKYNSHLLQYICQIDARVRVVGAAKISNESTPESEICERERAVKRIVGESRPIAAIEFNSMTMTVNSPTLLSSY